jgi:hypothetical protein
VNRARGVTWFAPLPFAIVTSLPAGSLLVRTWFGDDAQWQRVAAAAAQPSEDGFLANVRLVDDRTYEGIDAAALQASTPQAADAALVSFIADETTLTSDGWPILVVWVHPTGPEGAPDLGPFRVIASELWSVENNLNLSNMDWGDFQRSADPDGVFRGF